MRAPVNSVRFNSGVARIRQRIYNVDTKTAFRSYKINRNREAAMRVQIKKWGNSASVRIPASVMAAAALTIDQSVDVREERGRIIVEPIRAPVYDLDQLLGQMDPETFPDDVDFGPPAGRETW
jgi:antitoxin MazE